MRFVFLACLALLALAVDTFAQENKPTRLERWTQIATDHDRIIEEFYKSYDPEKVLTFEEKKQIYKERVYLASFEKIRQFFREDSTDEAAYQAATWLMTKIGSYGNWYIPNYTIDSLAWQSLARNHRESDHLAYHCLEASKYFSPAREEFLRKVINDDAQSDDVRAHARLSLGILYAKFYQVESLNNDVLKTPYEEEFVKWLVETQTDPEFIVYCKSKSLDVVRQEGITLLRSVIADSADIPVSHPRYEMLGDKSLGSRAGPWLHQLEHLCLYQPAPETTGKDLHGNDLKLADYHGKTILLNFWFTGCGPCVRMKAELLKIKNNPEHKDVVILCVTGDDDAQIAQKTLAESNLDVPTFHDRLHGPIQKTWNVHSYPQTYIIDPQGRIRGTCESLDVEAKLKKLATEE